MKSTHKIFLPVLVLVVLATAAAAFPYSISWYAVSAGGGTSTNGQYSISGTIGQADASGTISVGSYSLTGGFWSVYAVQSAEAPVLRIQLLGGDTVLVSWPSPSTGFNLQFNTDLATTNWATPAESVSDNGTNKFIIVSPLTGKLFYRLKSP